MKVFSKFISWVFLPLLAPVYALCIAMFVPSFTADFFQDNSLYILDFQAKKVLIYLFGFFSFLAPSLTVLFLQTRGMVSSVMMEKRSERIIPSLMVILYGISLLAILYLKVPLTFPGSKFLFGLALGSLIAVTCCVILTFKWKVSLHATGMGILSGFLYMYYSQMVHFPMWILVFAFITSGIVMAVRMVLNLHSLAQLLVGFVIGFVSLIFGILFYFID